MITRTLLGRYQIVAPLGKGGMGEVYRARDTKLGRDVAIKVLPEHLTRNSAAQKRFEREAKAVAALSHPNILSIFDSGTDQGVLFAVMELLEGQTLRQKLGGGSLPWPTAVEIASAVVDGLTAAHASGIIHRDLKPENIFIVNDGRVKILDFGLARWTATPSRQDLTEVPTVSELTEMGAVLGTVPYMSPEQIQGQSADARSDIFALGCVLHEMVTGARPFSGKSAAQISASILKDQPKKADNIPGDLQRIIDRCLEKDPGRRFHSAHDLAFALRDVSSPAQPAPPPAATRHSSRLALIGIILLIGIVALASWKFYGWRGTGQNLSNKIESIAVLPLQNFSGDSRQEYFADGMTEELIAKLAGISSLRVISRTSVMEYKGARKPLREIAKELEVDAIVEGSVLHAGNRVRVTAQLVDGATDRHLWANSYERDMQDVLRLQNEVATAIAKQIEAKLRPEERIRLNTAPQIEPKAYEAYLRGLNYAEAEISAKNLQLSIENFQKAVDLDPNFAVAFAELSRAQCFLYFTFERTPELLAKSKASLDRAFELSPDLTEAHIALGYYYYRGYRDYDRALQEWNIAEKKSPNNKWVLSGKSTVLRRQGRFQEAIEIEKKLMTMNPRQATMAVDLGITYSFVRQYDQAHTLFERAISFDPSGLSAYAAAAFNLLKWKGDLKAAEAMLGRCPLQNDPSMTFSRFLLNIAKRDYQTALTVSSQRNLPRMKDFSDGIVYRYLNKPEAARSSFEAARIEFEKQVRETPDDPEIHGFLGIIYAALGMKEEGIREGKRSVELLPVSRDAMWGPDAVLNLAFIYTIATEQELAIDQLEYLLSIPSNISVALLRLEPRWDPLRKHPRFQRLVK